MSTQPALHAEFARVVACDRCTLASDRNLLRDDYENVPQPGFVGRNYWRSRVLLVGQNPGVPKERSTKDPVYTAALRSLRDDPGPDRYSALQSILEALIPQWTVHGQHFPLAECGLTLDDIAYFNLVRCRTSNDKAPGPTTVDHCLNTHFTRWLDFLAPRVVVFIGKWAASWAGHIVKNAGIPFAYVNRDRSLTSEERAKNRAEVADLVRTPADAAVPNRHSKERAKIRTEVADLGRGPNVRTSQHSHLTVTSEPIPQSKLYTLNIYYERRKIGEYERSQEADIARKMEEIAAAEGELLEIYRTHGEFCVRWDGKKREKSIRAGGPKGTEVGFVPKTAWKTPSWEQ